MTAAAAAGPSVAGESLPQRDRAVLTASLIFVTTNTAVFLFLAVAMVPYWQELSAGEVQAWFADPFERFSWMMVPVHLLAISTTIYAFVRSRRRLGRVETLWWVALGGLLISQAFNFTVYGTVLNPDLASDSLEPSETLDTLDTWAQLHIVRTGFVLVAVGALAAINVGAASE